MSTDFVSLKDQPLDIRLSAYLDGQTSPEETRELESLIAENDEARQIFDRLALGSDLGNKAFEEMLNDPVPLNLVRAIKDAARKAEPVVVANGAPANGRNNIFSFMPRAIAASAILLLAGGYSGFVIGQQGYSQAPTEIGEMAGFNPVPASDGAQEGTKTRSFDMGNATKGVSVPSADEQLAGIWRAFQSTNSDIGLMSAADSAAMEQGFSQATGVSFKVPDLSGEGYRFVGGRLLADAGQPVAGLFYRDDAGKLLIVGYGKSASDAAQPGQIKQVGETTIATAKRDSQYVLIIGEAGLKHVDSLRDQAVAGL